MMDPLTALSLAANIAQFIDFGTKLIYQTKEIGKKGLTLEVEHLSSMTLNLIETLSSFKQQLVLSKGQDLEPPKEERALYELADKCNDLAEELIDCLDEVTVRNGERSKRKNVLAALKSIGNGKRFNSLAQTLSGYREQLTLSILVLLNARFAAQDEKLDQLQKSSEDIIEVVSVNHVSLQSTIEDLYRYDQTGRCKTRSNSDKEHTETIAAILTTRDGNSRTITGPNDWPDFGKQLPSLDMAKATITYRQAIGRSSRFNGQLADFRTEKFTKFAEGILDALWFRSIDDRREAVPNAHQKTFEWIYEDPVSWNKPWDSFSEWLKFGRGCYWIEGKAGSGKSTLMKYLQENTRTIHALKDWAGSSELIIGSFFFWYAGTPVQKSQVGLLRSLLLDVLERRTELVPILFPNACRYSLTGGSLDGLELSYMELKKAFRNLINSNPPGLKVFFIIDGIDEYDGDHDEISKLLLEATASDSIKILLSSRPIPSCVQAFSGCPQLRLQDLTFHDVRRYVHDKIGKHPLMRKLEVAENGAAIQIIDGVTSKASGAFLWVVLIVRNLVKGLQDYDTSVDLQTRLDELPPDLESLYDHMLGSMSPRNRLQGSKMLQLVLRSTELHGNYPMTVLQLSFADDENYEKSFKDRISGLSVREEAWRCEATEGRMRSRCCGLIEVQDPPPSMIRHNAGKPVRFLHRTVVEFLRTDTIWTQLVSLTNGTKFDVDRALLSSSLSEMLAKPPKTQQEHTASCAYHCMLRMLTYEQNMRIDVRALSEDEDEIVDSISFDGRLWSEASEHGIKIRPRLPSAGDDKRSGVFHDIYLPELRNVIGNHWHDGTLFGSATIDLDAIVKATVEGSKRLELSYPQSLLLLAGSCCSEEFLKGLLNFFQHSTDDLNDNDRAQLAAYLFKQYVDETNMPLRLVLSRNIMACSVHPDMKITFRRQHRKKLLADGTSLWELVLNYVLARLKSKNQQFIQDFAHTQLSLSFLDLIIAMVDAGADVNVRITAEAYDIGRYRPLVLYTFEVLYQLLSRLWQVRPSLGDHSGSASHSAALAHHNNLLAEKACHLEDTMRSRGCKSSKTDTNGASSSQFSIRYMDPSPWKLEMHPESEVVNIDNAREAPKLRRQKKQDTLPRIRQAELFVFEEVDLVADLARTDLSPRQQRSLLKQMSQQSYEQQSDLLKRARNLQKS